MRDRILAATADLLVEQGPQASMSKIAARANVAAGSLYNYFESKEDLLKAVYWQLSEHAKQKLTEDDDPDADPMVRLERYINNYIEFIWEDPKRAILFEYLANVPLLPPEVLIDSFQSTADVIKEILQDLRASGWLIDGSTILMGGFIGGAIRNMLKWQRIYGNALSDSDRHQIAVMCKQGLRRPGE